MFLWFYKNNHLVTEYENTYYIIRNIYLFIICVYFFFLAFVLTAAHCVIPTPKRLLVLC